MIKRIEINNLIGKDYIFNINGRKITYLFGENGIGKTSVLTALYNAIGPSNLLRHNFAPFHSIILTLNSGEKAVINGDKHEGLLETFKNIVNLRTHQDSIDDIELHFFNKERENEFKEKFNEFLNYINTKEISIPNEEIEKILRKILWMQQMDSNYIQDEQIEEKLSELLKIKKLDSKLIEESNENFKSKFKKWDVIYLTIERLAPEIVLRKYNEGSTFADEANEQKYRLTRRIEQISNEIGLKIKGLNEKIECFKKEIGERELRESISGEKSNNLDQLTTDEKEKINSNKLFLSTFSSILKHYYLCTKDEITLESISNNRYLSSLAKFLLTTKTTHEAPTIQRNEWLWETYEKMEEFLKTVNEKFFNANGKIIIWEKGSLELGLKIKDKIQKLNSYNYSNGEKQILVLLFDIYFHEKENLLIIADELESSLTPVWQSELYKFIKEREKIERGKVHLIGVTHSPFVCPQDKFDECMMSFENECVTNE